MADTDQGGTKTSPILKRNFANRNRHARLVQMKQGPGLFVYEGGHTVVEQTPTAKLIGKKEPSFDEDGAPLLDAQGRIIYKRAGKPMTGRDGKIVLGGKPKDKRIELDAFELWGTKFPKGVPVQVDDEDLALKLRCLGSTREIEDGEVVEGPKKRGRPRKDSGGEVAE